MNDTLQESLGDVLTDYRCRLRNAENEIRNLDAELKHERESRENWESKAIDAMRERDELRRQKAGAIT